MVVEIATDAATRHAPAAAADTAASRPGRLAREGLIERFNEAVRRPAAFGGVPVLPLLLDLIAGASQQTEDTVWIPDANQRLSTATLVLDRFADPNIHVAASQYGEDAYRRGWLRLDRTLSAAEHTGLVDGVAAWASTDRTVHDVLDAYGLPSVTFGDPDLDRPKSLSYACSDRTAPVVVFHFGPDQGGEPESAPERTKSSGAALLAVRGADGGFLGLQLTPRGKASRR
ncbi:hypothetical protein ABIA32_006039 [Streptacidiphilus sp. MAP12-20]|uniref:hypothetical protein n=1 Tax=Streptacidiphilus sp. MAP12-20 TaxID=3156299 RepID=UPI0035118D09